MTPNSSFEGTPSADPERSIVPTSSGPSWRQEATHRITRGGAEGFGVFDPATQLIKVLSGARIAKARKKGVPDRIAQLFDELLSAGGIIEEEDCYRLKTDTDWMRPSPAGCLVVNQSINGWDAWRAQDGAALQTLRSAATPTLDC
ncbi:DUF4357 domain-containing protein [Rubellimicrobium rubrum]|uniref:DUF4357 domain-containing protein n=1 Tax=Rubellimicrobium rubrum TaxID=2585369 RepID=UPI00159BA667